MTPEIFTRAKSKADLVEELARLIGLAESPKMSTGSTEPKEIFVAVNEALGLGFEADSLTKPQLAQQIVESAGIKWGPHCESRGGTVTRDGIRQVVTAVQFFLNVTPCQ